jgi:sulfite reductase beta subunit-like hemoprotein
LFDFLPHDQFARCTLAMLHLFSDHGDRANRHSARLRYVLKKQGEAAFIRLFHFYFEKTVWEPVDLPATPEYLASAPGSLLNNEQSPEDGSAGTPRPTGFQSWRAHALSPSCLGADQVVVRLYVPYGNVTPENCRLLARLAEDFGGGFLRLTQSQDFLLSPVQTDALPALYGRLISDFPDLDLTLKSFRGHIATCVGSTVCKIGILASPALADTLAQHLDGILPADTPEKLAMLRRVTDDIRISGCPNSCSGHPSAWLGFQGQKQRIDDKVEDVLLPFTGRSVIPGSLRLSTHDEAIPAITVANLPAFVVREIGLKVK